MLKIKKDKIVHVLSSFSILLLILFISGSYAFATIITIIIGLSKEYIWDKLLGRGTLDYWDICCNLLGVLLAIILMKMIG